MIPIVARSLPESIDFLLARRPKDTLPRMNELLRRMGRPAVAALPERATEEPKRGNPLARLFAPAIAAQTLLIWSAFFLTMLTFYS